jgi:hypothetical protein
VTGEGDVGTGGIDRHPVRRRNPLRRRSDRIEATLTFVLVMTMLLIAPWAAWSIAGQTYRDEVRAGDWDRSHRFSVTAELLRDAPGADNRAADAITAAPQGTQARWTGPDQVVHVGPVPADYGSRQGSTIKIWIDEYGAPAGPPLRRNPVLDASLIALLIVCGLGIGLFATHRLVVWALDRKRMRAWEQEWLVVEPGWTHR